MKRKRESAEGLLGKVFLMGRREGHLTVQGRKLLPRLSQLRALGNQS